MRAADLTEDSVDEDCTKDPVAADHASKMH